MLEIEDIVKRYLPPPALLRPLIRVASRTPVDALHNVSFQVGKGEIVGLVGPNGAGKSTLIRIIATLLEPTTGSVIVDGYEVSQNPKEVRKRIGLVLEGDRGLYGRLTGRQNLELFGILYGLAPAISTSRAEALLESFDLAGRDKLVFGYSSGMRARLCLARALIADPPLLLLDEPSRSLDPVASHEMGRRLHELAREGRSILFSSHRLDEISRLCDRVVVLMRGTVKHIGPPSELDINMMVEEADRP